MLVLTRKRAEMIRIGDDIVIKVIKTGNGSVKLGIDAPPDVRVVRAELLERTIPFPTPEPEGSNLRLAAPLHYFLEDTFAGPLRCSGSVS